MNKFGETLRSLREEKELNQDDLAVLLQVKRASISDYERGKTEPSFSALISLAEFFGVTVDQLLRGGAHLNRKGKRQENAHLSAHLTAHPTGQNRYETPDQAPSEVNERMMAMYNRVPQVVTVDREGRDNIAYVPAKAKAGYLTGYADAEFVATLPTYNFPGLQNATFRMFEIEGHSMIPTFDDSDIVIGRFVENLSQIRNDRVHIIVTKHDGLLIKRVLNRAVSDGKLILNSDNQKDTREYPPIVIGVDEVLEIWYGVARFTRQMRAPGEMYNRLIDLEARLTLIEDFHRKAVR